MRGWAEPMQRSAGLFAAAILLAMLAGCGGMANPPSGLPNTNEVVGASEQGGRFLSFIGPRRQHAEPFLGVPSTNYYALRSLVDTRTGEIVHQLFVEESYFGAERNWQAARDGEGRELRFVAVSKNEITCESSCSYAEEFAAVLPEALLRGSPQGLTVTFTARSGDTKQIAVPPDLIRKQLAAVDGSAAARPTALAR
jgi:hypothetical protein